MQDETLKVGLLMESMQAQQRLVEENLAGLRAHTRDLDTIVRDEIRRTFLEELPTLRAEADRAVDALRSAARAAGARRGLLMLAFAVACALGPTAVLWTRAPSRVELDALRSEQEKLAGNLARLRAAGADVEWRRCGDSQRLCARVDRSAPSYGERGDFLVLKGY